MTSKLSTRFCFKYKAFTEWNKGFTLAEILITIGIIGIVVALTIPPLISKINDAEYKTAYKKAYSAISQAWLMAYSESLLKTRTANSDDPINNENFNAFKSKLSTVKDCDSNNNSDCWTTNGYKWDTSYPAQSGLSFVDKSGMAWTQPLSGHYYIFVDTNGDKKPNDWGKDRFPFFPEAKNGKIGISTNAPAGTATCPNSSHICYYTTWLIN